MLLGRVVSDYTNCIGDASILERVAQKLAAAHGAACCVPGSSETKMTAQTIEIVHELPKLKPRPADSNKGNFGRVLVVAGSRGMSGAAILCASAALRAGAGLVKVGTPSEILSIVAAGNPCCTSFPLPQDADGRIAQSAIGSLMKLIETHDVLTVGPGLDRSPALPPVLSQ